MTVGDRLCTKGMHLTLGVGVPLGTVVAGNEGVTLYETRLGDPTAWYVHPNPFEGMATECGVVPLPVPELNLPVWMGDKRTIYA